MNPKGRMKRLLKHSKQIPIDDRSKIVLISDCHRGDGSGADDFSKNQALYYAALQYYDMEGFTYIEMGDGDELWENKSFAPIAQTHGNTFYLLSKLHRESRLYFLYGNHDAIKKKTSWVEQNLYSYFVPHDCEHVPLFPQVEIHESLILNHRESGGQLLLMHGHQADFFNYDLWPLARFLVRYLWRPLQLLGVRDPTSARKNYGKRKKIDDTYIRWTKQEKIILVAGHTHQSVFPQPGEHLYFNDGCCVHPRCITAIEIENGSIVLVKWSIMVRRDGVLAVDKTVLEGPERVSDYFTTPISPHFIRCGAGE